jgi:hypothetical protein
MMKRKQDRIELARKIISTIKKEMQKPRLAESVRKGQGGQEDQAASFASARFDRS